MQVEGTRVSLLPARLPPRLRAVLDATPAGSTVADIGCDHGLLAASLALSGRAARVYACDVSRSSLAGAARTLRDAQCARVELRCGDGLSSLTAADGVDTVAMAGLGVDRTVSILRAGLRSEGRERGAGVGQGVKTLVLQPVAPRLASMVGLRLVLRRLGFQVASEHFMTEERKGVVRPYLTLTAVRQPHDSAPALSERAKLLGTAPPLNDSTFLDYVRHQRDWLAERRDGGGQARSTSQRRQLRRKDAWIRTLDDVLDECRPLSTNRSARACAADRPSKPKVRVG